MKDGLSLHQKRYFLISSFSPLPYFVFVHVVAVVVVVVVVVVAVVVAVVVISLCQRNGLSLLKRYPPASSFIPPCQCMLALLFLLLLLSENINYCQVARLAAERLNCQPVGGKRKSKAHDQTWNIKYLPRSEFN